LFIVDDHPVVRCGLARWVADHACEEFEVCGEADNVTEALQRIAHLRPDVVVVDMLLEDRSGLELIAEVKAGHPEIKTIIWSTFDEHLFGERAVRAGALGYVSKQEPVETLVEAIRQVLRGEIHLSPGMTNLLLQRVTRGRPVGEDPICRFTDREMVVFEMIGRGMTTVEIARKLGLSRKTVESHREKIKRKLHIKSATELSLRAVQWVLENG